MDKSGIYGAGPLLVN